MTDAMRNNEFVHCTDVESLLIAHDGAVQSKAAAEPPKERWRSSELGELGIRMRERWAAMFSMAWVLVKMAGGVVGFTNFVVNMIVRVLDRKHKGHSDRELIDEETLKQGFMQNVRVRATLMKWMKEFEGIPVSRFRFATITAGVTQRGFNALRFAMHGWAPGCARMLRDMYAYLKHLNETYVPAGPEIEIDLDLDEQEQANERAEQRNVDIAAEEDEVANDGELGATVFVDLQHATDSAAGDEAIAAARIEAACDDADVDVVAPADVAVDWRRAAEQQVLDLLAIEFPRAPTTGVGSLSDKWEGMETEQKVFEGSELLQVVAQAADGRVKGFAKGFRMQTQGELYFDETLIAEEDRGQELLPHMILALIDLCEQGAPKVKRVRMQCEATKHVVLRGEEKAIDMVEKVYKRVGISTPWKEKTTGAWEGVGPNEGYVMVTGTRASVLKACEARTNARPLDMGVEMNVRIGGWKDDVEMQPALEDTEDPNADDEEEAELRQRVRDERNERVVDDGETIFASHGSHNAVDPLATMLVPIMFLCGSLLRPGSPYSRVGVNPTCDAATLKHGPKKNRTITTAMLRLLSWGVETGKWGGNAVSYMMPGAMSAQRAFKLRVWLGKDSRELLKRYFAPYVNQLMKLTKTGITFDALLQRPPWYWVADENGRLRRVDMPIRSKPGTKANVWAADEREFGCKDAHAKVAVCLTGDGAMLQQATDTCGVSENKADFYTAETKKNMALLLKIEARAPEESLRELAERLVPGCGDVGHRHHWILSVLPRGNSHSMNAAAQGTTREPEEVKRNPGGSSNVGGESAAAKKKHKQLLGSAASDGREAKPKVYKDPHVRTLKYDHRGFIPRLDGDADDALDSTMDEWNLVRFPVIPEFFDRDFDAVWDKEFGKLEDELGGCLVHGGMRTGEGSLGWLVKPLVDRYAKHRNTIEKHLNAALKRNLPYWYRTLISQNNKGEMNDIALNGSDVAVLFNDFSDDNKESELMRAVRKSFKEVGIDDAIAHLDEWEECLRHWGKAMKVGWKLHTTEEDRRLFSIELRLYVLKKVMIKNEGLKWYDWQFWSIFPILLERFGSLRLISQETQEAQQALNNQLLQRSNGFGNVGRLTNKSIADGTTQEYKDTRKKGARTVQRWLWERQELSWFAQVHEVFDRLEVFKAAGNMVPYLGEPWSYAHVPAVLSFEKVTPPAIRLIARSRARGRDRAKLTLLARLVRDAQADLQEDVDRVACMAPEDRRVALLRARKQRFVRDHKKWDDEDSIKALLHRALALDERSVDEQGDRLCRFQRKELLMATFGEDGTYPFPCGRDRAVLS